jgi:DNA-binding NtrC family response regulator
MAQERPPQAAPAVVLLVEGDALRRAAKATELRKEGFEVLEAAGAAEAKAILDATVVDVVFSDIDLIDGPALAQWLEQWRPAIPFAWIINVVLDRKAMSCLLASIARRALGEATDHRDLGPAPS